MALRAAFNFEPPFSIYIPPVNFATFGGNATDVDKTNPALWAPMFTINISEMNFRVPVVKLQMFDLVNLTLDATQADATGTFVLSRIYPVLPFL